ncbi:MAG: N-acetyl-gamma-glutamyl-phosphate reductase, partial [Dehalococcoidia bacterium]|nr:N-acetyl-gamma-glutamyl-phosphate reductase [Dehalococcoidia bacterium]
VDAPIAAELPDDCEFVISCLPHKASAEALLPWIDRGVPVIDVAADFRLRDPATYQQWYDTAPPRPELLPTAVYGLTETKRAAIRGAAIVANPGCFPTAALLAILPAVQLGFAQPDVIVDAKTGVSGGGRSLTLANHFSEVNENLAPYSVTGHRHLPEIVQELAEATTTPPRVTFIPHLAPMTRGILATCYLPLADRYADSDPTALQAQITACYQEFYAAGPFVLVTRRPPATKATYGSNRCLLTPTVDARARRLVVFGALDNLIKGAAGQAVQNLNVMLDWPETMGLDLLPVYP